jgi:nitrile hydratase accessory protein
MALVLHERGVFTWKEWAATLAEEIKTAQPGGDPGLGTAYYHHWIKALERLVVAKGVATEKALVDTARAWQDASARHTARQADCAQPTNSDESDPLKDAHEVRNMIL